MFIFLRFLDFYCYKLYNNKNHFFTKEGDQHEKGKIFTKKLLMPLFLFMLAFALLTATKTDASAASKRPGAVKGFTAKPDYKNGGIKLSWKQSRLKESYDLYYKTSKNGKFKPATFSYSIYSYYNSRIKNCDIDSLPPGKIYYFKVRAYTYHNGKHKYGKFSSVKSAKAVVYTPNISLSLKSENSVSVGRCSAAFDGNFSYNYELYRSTSKSGKYKKVKTIKKKEILDYYDRHGSDSSYTYTDKKLKPGKYYYKVKCYTKVKGKKVYSKFSPIESIVVPKKVNINLDNWSQYYEVVPSYELNLIRNDFNEVINAYTSYAYYLKLKDKYSCFVDSSDDYNYNDSKLCTSNVALELEYTINQRQAIVDWNTGKITPGAVVPDDDNEYPYTNTKMTTFTSDNNSLYLTSNDNIYKDIENPVVKTVENLNMKRIQGTLYLEKW